MLEIKNVNIRLKKNNKSLLEKFDFVLHENDKVAIIGEEGNGKSTLLKYIYDDKLIKDYCVFKGYIKKDKIKIGYLEQYLSEGWNNYQVIDYFLKENINSDIDYDIHNRYGNIEQIFSKLNIDTTMLENGQLIGTLSGGEKIKIQLAKLLLNKCDILLLDEPTNDLDIETLEWLENFINYQSVPIIFISHDEELLENTANIIIHLEQVKKKQESRYTIAKMSYREYAETRLRGIEKQTQLSINDKSEYDSEKKRLYEIKDKVQRANPGRTNRMNSIIAQEEKLLNRDLTEKPNVEEEIKLFFDENIYVPNGKVILELNLPILENPKGILSRNIECKVVGPKHVVIIGNNGVGKSTLIKEIYTILKNKGNLNVGYMPQSYEERMPLSKTPIEFLNNDLEKDEITKIRTMLGSLKFTSDEMTTEINNLSGGQKAKILLSKMIIDECMFYF